MRLCHVTLSVKDMETSLRFYRDVAGLDIQRRFSAGSGVEIVFLGNGETEVELISGRMHEGMELGKGISLGFAAVSLEDTIALLREKGFETDGVIECPNPNTSFFFARDPDGFNIQFVKE